MKHSIVRSLIAMSVHLRSADTGDLFRLVVAIKTINDPDGGDISEPRSLLPLITSFDTTEALRILTLKKPDFYGQQATVFAGFCAWVVSPADQSLIKAAMVIKAAEQYHSAVKHCERKRPGLSLPLRQLEREIAVRESSKYQGFFDHLFSPIELEQLQQKVRSTNALKKALRTRATDIQYVLKLVYFMHFVEHKSFPTGKFQHAHIENSIKIFSKLPALGFSLQGGMSKNRVRARWRQSRESVAFLYAAHSIKCDSGKSLLDLILTRQLTYTRAGPYLFEWFGFSNHITDTVLVNVKDNRNVLPNFPHAVGVATKAFDPRILDDPDCKKVVALLEMAGD